MPADFTLKATLPPFSGKGAAMLSSVMPGYHSGQRLASLKSAMVSCGEASIWTLRCTIAIVDLLARLCRHASVTWLGQLAAGGDGTIMEMVTYGSCHCECTSVSPGSRFQTVSKFEHPRRGATNEQIGK